MTHHAERRRSPRGLGPFVGLALLLPALAACQQAGREVTGSTSYVSHRDRHPIVLGDAPRVLDVFVEGHGLTGRHRQDLAGFVAEHARFGNSNLVAQVPAASRGRGGVDAALSEIRAAVGGRLAVLTYQPQDPSVASPIRLSFQRLQARVTSKCGLWPEDLGVSDLEWGEKNREYWNFGCAAQSNLASQIADPVDLVRGRAETAPDTQRRLQNITKLRQAQDPSTQYIPQQNGLNQLGSQ